MKESPEVLLEGPQATPIQDLIFINKPAGYLSIPAPKAQEASTTPVPVLSQWIKDHLHFEPKIIHRLDRYTSGIIIFAKTLEAQKRASAWFEKREIKKEYYFLAGPTPPQPALKIQQALQGKSAQTLFEVLETHPSKTLFLGKATPLTGRFHQIRIHAKAAGFPLMGDQGHQGLMSWAQGSESVNFPHFALHAGRLKGQHFDLTAPFPQHFKEWLTQCNFKLTL